ncbi:MAG: hypothetical protein ACLTNN_08505 [Blautia sp.]
MDRWLKDHGMPPITRVYKTTRDGKRLTLEDECLQSCSLPSIAYGFKRCSLKHKIGPQEKFCNHYPPCQQGVGGGQAGGQVHRLRRGRGLPQRQGSLLGDLADRKYSKWYPLMEWGWTRDDCIRQIEAAGCPSREIVLFFCPSMKPDEITGPAGAAIPICSAAPGAGGQRPEKPENGQGPGAEPIPGENDLERSFAHMATVEKIRNDIAKDEGEDRRAQQKRRRELEASSRRKKTWRSSAWSRR